MPELPGSIGIGLCAVAGVPTLSAAQEPPSFEDWDWSRTHRLPGLEEGVSGLCRLPDGTFLAARDNGSLLRIAQSLGPPPAGGWPRVRLPRKEPGSSAGTDLEGLCLSADGLHVLGVLEDSAELLSWSAHDLDFEGRVSLDAAISGGSPGLEGLAWVPAEDGPPSLWLGHQGSEKVLVVEAPRTPLPGTRLALWRELDVGDELRGLLWDSRRQVVIAVADDARELWMLDRKGRVLASRPWPEGYEELEGVEEATDGALLLALDGGGIARVPLRRGAKPELESFLERADWGPAGTLLAARGDGTELLGYCDEESLLLRARPASWPTQGCIAPAERVSLELDGAGTCLALHPTRAVAYLGVSLDDGRRGALYAIALDGERCGAVLGRVGLELPPRELVVCRGRSRLLLLAAERVEGRWSPSVASYSTAALEQGEVTRPTVHPLAAEAARGSPSPPGLVWEPASELGLLYAPHGESSSWVLGVPDPAPWPALTWPGTQGSIAAAALWDTPAGGLLAALHAPSAPTARRARLRLFALGRDAQRTARWVSGLDLLPPSGAAAQGGAQRSALHGWNAGARELCVLAEPGGALRLFDVSQAGRPLILGTHRLGPELTRLSVIQLEHRSYLLAARRSAGRLGLQLLRVRE